MKKRIVSLIMICVLMLGTAVPAAQASLADRLNEYLQSSYKTLSIGSKGSEVKKLQEKLISLGYLAYGEADGAYGKKTAKAVHTFKSLNGIDDFTSHEPAGCIATTDMQLKLFGSYAARYSEPYIALQICDYSNMNWYKEDNNKFKFRIQVENISKSRTIKAFELYAYATDVWGDEIYGDSYYYETTKKDVGPGVRTYSDYFIIPRRDEICKVYVGVHKVIYSDGTIAEDYSVDYSNWEPSL